MLWCCTLQLPIIVVNDDTIPIKRSATYIRSATFSRYPCNNTQFFTFTTCMTSTKNHLNYIIATFIIIFGSVANLQCFAQHRTRVFGTIKDTDGAPIELATVRAIGQTALTFTNLKGEYSLWCTSGDSVRISYSMIGYETRKRLLRNPGDSIRLDVVLPPYDPNTTLGTARYQTRPIHYGQWHRRNYLYTSRRFHSQRTFIAIQRAWRFI